MLVVAADSVLPVLNSLFQQPAVQVATQDLAQHFR